MTGDPLLRPTARVVTFDVPNHPVMRELWRDIARARRVLFAQSGLVETDVRTVHLDLNPLLYAEVAAHDSCGTPAGCVVLAAYRHGGVVATESVNVAGRSGEIRWLPTGSFQRPTRPGEALTRAEITFRESQSERSTPGARRRWWHRRVAGVPA